MYVCMHTSKCVCVFMSKFFTFETENRVIDALYKINYGYQGVSGKRDILGDWD